MLRRLFLISIILMFLGVPSWAGDAFVPITQDITVGEYRLETRIWIANQGADQTRRTTPTFIPTWTDGSTLDEDDAFDTINVSPLQSALYTGFAGAGENGMLRLESAPQIVVSGHMVVHGPTGGGVVAASIPIITSDNAFFANENAHLQGWVRDGSQVTDLTIVNLAYTEAICYVDVYRTGGGLISAAGPLTIPALGHGTFPDALAILGESSISGVRSRTTCDKQFYTFASVFNTSTGAYNVLEPAGTGESTLSPPVQTGPCPEGAFCSATEGVFFEPSPGNNKKRIDFPFENGTLFSRAEIEVSVYHGGWFSSLPDGIHNFLYFNRADSYGADTFGLITGRGPNRHKFKAVYNAGQADNIKIERTVVINPGDTYRLFYTYDYPADFVHVRLVAANGNGATLVDATGRAAGKLRVAGGMFSLGFSDNRVEAHVPSWDWTWADLDFRLIP